MQDKIPGAERVYEIVPDGASSIASLILTAVGAGNQKARIPTSGMAGVMRVRLVGAGGQTVTDPVTTQATTIPAGADPFTCGGPRPPTRC